MPTPEHIIEKQLYNLADRIEKVKVDDEEIDKYLPGVSRKLGWLSQEDLLKRVLSLEFNRLLDYYRDAPVIDFIDEKPRREKPERPKTTRTRNGARLSAAWHAFMSTQARPTAFLKQPHRYAQPYGGGQACRRGTHRPDAGIFAFDVPKADARRVVGALSGAEYAGKRIYSEIADPDKDYARASARKKRGAVAEEKPETTYEYFLKKNRGAPRKAPGRKNNDL